MKHSNSTHITPTLSLLPKSRSKLSFLHSIFLKKDSIFETNLLSNRYGSIFKSHILGCPCVMISSPEAAKLVLVSKAHLFKPTFPASKERMLGKQAIFFHQGDYHTKLRKLVLRAFMPEAIKSIVSEVESIAVNTLESWQGESITTFQEMKTVCFSLFFKQRTPVFFF